jgi:predicted DNA-binding WGR domain protein
VKRYFEFVDAKSSKFWEVWVENTSLSIRFGKIGTNGQTTLKEFPDAEAAEQARDKAIAEKIRKGYVEVSNHD